MRNLLTLFVLLAIGLTGHAQLGFPESPKQLSNGYTPDWTPPAIRAAVDTCGAYFNNYIGLVKTTDIYYEELRTGDGMDYAPYSGRAQRFHAYQPIEISGIQFYSFQTNPDLDSLMVITLLLDYDEVLDSIGVELARDTVWVKHTYFTPLLTELEVNSYFDEPVTVTEDYIIAMYTSTNDSLKIITNSAVDGDGDGEGLSFAYYNNAAAPSYTGWYATLPVFGPSYDLDYLMNPLVRYKLHDDFLMSDDAICPTIVSGVCLDYTQVANFSDPHYNRFYATPTVKVNWNWGDGLQNTMLTSLCHTYAMPGTYTITLKDSIRRHDYFDFTCAIERTKTIVVLDSIFADGSAMISGFTGNFTNLSDADSVYWDFGDGTEGTNEENPTHTFPGLGSYDVWLYAFGPCNSDSILITISTDDVGIEKTSVQWNMYPNPANDILTISAMSDINTIELLNTIGEQILIRQVNSMSFTMNTAEVAEGTYFVRLSTDNGQTIKMLVVNH